MAAVTPRKPMNRDRAQFLLLNIGHFLAEENPDATAAALAEFFA